jgi:hypothetical protein
MIRLIAILLFFLALFGPLRAAVQDAEAVRSLLAEDRWKEALALARDQADLEEGESGTALGEALFRAGELAEAAAVLSSVVERYDPPPVRALVRLGLLRLSEGRDRTGAELLQQALAIAPDDPYVLFWAAGAAGSREQVIAALKRYIDRVGEAEPDRVEGARGTIRFLTALGDRETWIQDARPASATLALRKVPGPAGQVRGYTLKATVGERQKPVRILLDTGSPGFYLDDRIARKHGMKAVAEETVFGGGGSGRHRSERGILSRLETGPISFRDVTAFASDTRLDLGASFRGLIGLGPFRGYIITLDLAEGEMLFSPPPPSGEPWSGEGWSRGARYWTVSGQMLVEAGDAGGARGLFILDTGAGRSLVSENFVERVDGVVVRREGAVRGFGGVRAESQLVQGVDLRFQGLAGKARSLGVADLNLRSRLSGVEICGFIGLEMLAGQVIRIDTLAQRVFVKKQGHR